MREILVHKLMCDPYKNQRKSLFFLSGRMFGSVKYVGQSLVEVSVRYPISFVFPTASYFLSLFVRGLLWCYVPICLCKKKTWVITCCLPLMPLKQVWYHNIMVIVWLLLSLFCPLTRRHSGQVFLGLSDLTIIQNSHTHCAKIDMSAVQIHLAHLCKKWKPLCYGMWQYRPLCLFHLLFRNFGSPYCACPNSMQAGSQGTMACTCHIP
jgi:hypothetical protein